MHVPSYVPEPIEIDGNVAQERWPAIVQFVRRVTAIHLGTLGLIVALSMAPIAPMPLEASLSTLLATLVSLSLLRGMGKGKPWEQTVSALLAPLLLVLLGLIVKEVRGLGWPVWTFFVGPICGAIYVLLANRDLSFLGLFLSSSAGGLLAVAVGWRTFGALFLAEVLLANTAYLLYHVYDLAALLTRRRLGEEWGAVLDLYRDVLNMFSYPFRVARHWRKHRLWSLPRA